MAAVRKSLRNAFEVLCPTRQYGLGARVTRGIWAKYAEPSFWEVTRVRPAADLKHGKVYGKFTFRGTFIGLLDVMRAWGADSGASRQVGRQGEAHQRRAQEGLVHGRAIEREEL